MKTVTVLSGKGGVGKSSITASLAVVLSEKRKIVCADCDVDASNLSLVLGANQREWKPISTNQKAEFDLSKCTSCRKCIDSCFFDAIEWVDNRPKLKEFGCEGCGVCSIVCPEGAVSEREVENARMGYAETGYGFDVVSAQLNIGESGSGKIVSEVKKRVMNMADKADIILIDSAAGIGCPVIASVTGSDYVIVVTEPTPSAFSDMKRALEVVDHFRIPYGIVINRHDINPGFTEGIESFAKEKGIDILARIPYDRAFVEALVNLTPAVVQKKGLKPIFEGIAERIGI